MLFSNSNPIGDISARRLTRPDDLHYLAPGKSEVLGHRVLDLDLWNLMFLDPVFVKELLRLLVAQNGVFWHHLVMSDVNLQVSKLDDLDWDNLKLLVLFFL